MFAQVMQYEYVDDHEVNRHSPVAAYIQVAGFLREAITAGEYEPGQRLPSITDLVQTYGIARLTAAKALRRLAAEGLAGVSPGMGFYVTPPRGDAS